MTEVDYGYGEQDDYGYGDAEPDIIAEETSNPQPSYYTAPAVDGANDYGYGDDESNMMQINSSSRSLDQPSSHVRRPKRRCSVTKFTLESGDAPTSLTAASVIANMRNGIAPPSSSSHEQDGSANMLDSKEKYGTTGMMTVTPCASSDFDEEMMNDMETDVGSDDNIIDPIEAKKRSGMFRLLSLKRTDKK